jgi:hypothetical protein
MVIEDKDKMITNIAQRIAGRNPATFRQTVFEPKMRGNLFLAFGKGKNFQPTLAA